MHLLFLVVQNDEGTVVRQKVAEWGGDIRYDGGKARDRYEGTKQEKLYSAREKIRESNLEWFPGFEGEVIEVHELEGRDDTPTLIKTVLYPST